MRFIERSSRSLARHTFYAMARYQARLDRKQVLLGHIVDIGAELFAMSAVCTRATAMRHEDPAVGRNAIELADAFCAQSRLRVEGLFRSLRGSTAASDDRLAGAVMAGRLRWVEDGIVDASEGTGPWIATRTP